MLYFGVVGRSVTVLGLVGRPIWEHLPVAYPSLGLSPLSVGFLLSTNRWVRLFTNVPAAWLLGSKPIRQIFFIVLVVGSSCSLAYAATTNLFLLLLARAAWGSCWSIIRLAGLVTLPAWLQLSKSNRRPPRHEGFWHRLLMSRRWPCCDDLQRLHR